MSNKKCTEEIALLSKNNYAKKLMMWKFYYEGVELSSKRECSTEINFGHLKDETNIKICDIF